MTANTLKECVMDITITYPWLNPRFKTNPLFFKFSINPHTLIFVCRKLRHKLPRDTLWLCSKQQAWWNELHFFIVEFKMIAILTSCKLLDNILKVTAKLMEFALNPRDLMILIPLNVSWCASMVMVNWSLWNQYEIRIQSQYKASGNF